MLRTKVKKIILLISFLLIVISLIGFVSYSYYISEIYGNESESTVAITGGNIIIKYQNDSSDIVASGIYIGWSTTKEFTVSYSVNASNINVPSAVSYEMFLIVDRNDFLSGSLQYQLMPKSSDSTKTGVYSDSSYYDIPIGINLNGILMGKGFLVDQNVSHSYVLSIKYREHADIDQYAENDAIFNARVNIKGASEDSYSTLYLDLNGGEIAGISLSNDNSIKVPMNKEFSLPVPTKETPKYKFTGWEITSGDGTVSGNTIIANSLAITVQAQYVKLQSFADDDWATIAANVQAKKAATASTYKVGDTKEVTIDGTNYTVRIANNSNYDCTLDSKTACGFVVEFVDIITSYNMNPAGTYNGIYYENGTHLGGWPSSAMYKYLNGDTPDHLTYDGSNATLYSKLPSDLRSAIKDTYTVSGHGSKDTGTRSDGNFESTDKLYLLSTGEIYGNCLTENCYDTASYPYNNSGATTTRQLDYYNGVTVTTRENYEKAIKQKNGSNTWWWLRGANAYSSSNFRFVTNDGSNSNSNADNSGGVAPAFRIA